MTRRLKEFGVVLLVASVVTVVATWPLPVHLGSAGRIDSGDGRFSVWNVAWVANTLTTNPGNLWNANIFFPHTNTLTFSEANLVAGVLAIPVWLVTHNPYAATNAATLFSFVLAALAMFALVRHLTHSFWAGLVSAVLYAFSPFAFAHIPQIQLLMTFGPPLALLSMHRFVEAPSARRAALLGATLALEGLACGYYGVYGGLAVAFGLVWFGLWSGRWREPRFWFLVALAAIVALALVAPFLARYAGMRAAGFERTLDDARLFRAGWRSYLASPLLVHQWLLSLLPSWREVLFPGFLTIGLAGVAIWRAVRARSRFALPTTRYVVGYYLALAALAMWGSFGPDAKLYKLLYDVVPFMSFLRAPARLGLLVTLALGVAGGIGLASLERTSSRLRRRVLLAACVCYAIGRSTVGGLDLAAAPPVSSVYTWLGRLPRGAVAEFPYFVSAPDRHRHTEYMLMSTQHWQPLINGYSDFFPDDVWEAMGRLSAFPSPDSFRVLEARQARYVVIHWDLYEPTEREQMKQTVRGLTVLELLVDEPRASLFQLRSHPSVIELAARGTSSQPDRDHPARD